MLLALAQQVAVQEYCRCIRAQMLVFCNLPLLPLLLVLMRLQIVLVVWRPCGLCALPFSVPEGLALTHHSPAAASACQAKVAGRVVSLSHQYPCAPFQFWTSSCIITLTLLLLVLLWTMRLHVISFDFCMSACTCSQCLHRP